MHNKLILAAIIVILVITSALVLGYRAVQQKATAPFPTTQPTQAIANSQARNPLQGAYIPEDDPTAIQLSGKTVLTIDALPRQSSLFPLPLTGGGFESAALSPDGNTIAFTLVGGRNDWIGILDLETRSIHEVSFISHGFVGPIYWAPTSRHFAVETIPARGLGVIEIVDREAKQVVVALSDQYFGGTITETYAPSWSNDGTELFFVARFLREQAKRSPEQRFKFNIGLKKVEEAVK